LGSCSDNAKQKAITFAMNIDVFLSEPHLPSLKRELQQSLEELEEET
jgi:hypothetical protein